jgi:acyl-CoA thioesterase
MGDYCVTLQGNINYVKPAEKDDVLLVTGKICHNGRKTKVIEVNIIDQNGSLICKSTFTMYSVGKISE